MKWEQKMQGGNISRWLTLVLALTAGCRDNTSDHTRPRPYVKEALSDFGVMEIPIGYIGYNQGPFRSYNFEACSAVILDYGDHAVFAHALPSDRADSTLTNSHNAIGRLVQELERYGIDSQQTEAIVHAGRVEYLSEIIKQLRQNGIRIRSAEFVDAQLRDIAYDPCTDTLEVRMKGR